MGLCHIITRSLSEPISYMSITRSRNVPMSYNMFLFIICSRNGPMSYNIDPVMGLYNNLFPSEPMSYNNLFPQ